MVCRKQACLWPILCSNAMLDQSWHSERCRWVAMGQAGVYTCYAPTANCSTWYVFVLVPGMDSYLFGTNKVCDEVHVHVFLFGWFGIGDSGNF